MLGRAGQNWNPNVRSRIRSEKNATVLCRDPQGRRWLAWNADEYKEKMHRAWGAEPGGGGNIVPRLRLPPFVHDPHGAGRRNHPPDAPLPPLRADFLHDRGEVTVFCVCFHAAKGFIVSNTADAPLRSANSFS